ncbi:beta-propeller fold lactonase family protein, partial [Bacillus pseudomycoides]
TAPVRVGEFGTEDLNSPFGVATTGTTLYVANVGDSTVAIYNITNTTAPVHVGEFNAGNLDEPAVLAITGTTLYVANNANDTVEIYDIINPTAPVRVGEFGAGDLDFPNGLAVSTLLGDSIEMHVISCHRLYSISTF